MSRMRELDDKRLYQAHRTLSARTPPFSLSPDAVGGEGWGEGAAAKVTDRSIPGCVSPSPYPLPHRERWGEESHVFRTLAAFLPLS